MRSAVLRAVFAEPVPPMLSGRRGAGCIFISITKATAYLLLLDYVNVSEPFPYSGALAVPCSESQC
jgi:hypothetical protein